MTNNTITAPNDRIRQQRDELLEAAKRIKPHDNAPVDWYRLQAAIEKADDD